MPCAARPRQNAGMPQDAGALWDRLIALHDLLFDDEGRVRVDPATAAAYRAEIGQLSDALRRLRARKGMDNAHAG